MYDKTVRRRRAVLGLLVACSLILLTAYFGESAGGGLHSVAARRAARSSRPIQEGASRALKPVRDLVRLGRRHARRQGRARGRCARSATRCARRSSQRRTRCARTRQLRELLELDDERRARATTARSRARVIGRRRPSGTRRSRSTRARRDGVRVGQPVVDGDGLVGHGHARVAPARRRDADHRPRRLGVSARGQRERRHRASCRPSVGDPTDLRARATCGATTTSRGPDASSPPAPTSKSTGTRPRSPGHPDRPRDAGRRRGHRRRSRSTSRPFADLRRLDFVQVLTKRRDGGPP